MFFISSRTLELKSKFELLILELPEFYESLTMTTST